MEDKKPSLSVRVSLAVIFIIFIFALAWVKIKFGEKAFDAACVIAGIATFFLGKVIIKQEKPAP